MKKYYSLLLILALFFTLVVPIQVTAANPIVVYLNGEKLSFPTDPIVENGTTLVPFRVIFEKLGMTVEWNAETKEVTAYKDWIYIKFKPGLKKVLVNGETYEFSVPSKVINNTTFVPLRFVSEVAGKVVNWDGKTSTVTITDTILDGNIKVTDASTIYKRLKNLEITSLAFDASLNMESELGVTMDTYVEGKTTISPTLITHVKGTSYIMDSDFDFEMYTNENRRYVRNFAPVEWAISEEPSIGLESAFNLIQFLPKEWDSAITNMKSDFSFEGLILELYLDPKKYDKVVSPYLTDSTIIEVNHYYILDPKTFMPRRVVLQLVEEKTYGSKSKDFIEFDFYNIHSINEITEIPAPKDLPKK